MKLSVITINYNTQKLLEACLRSLKANIKEVDYEVIVVDNASNTFDITALKKIFPNVKIIRSKQNLGFAKANNLAAKQVEGEYLWFLNSDTKLTLDSNIQGLINFLDSNPNYVAVSPLIIDESGLPQKVQFGYWPAVWRMTLEKFAKVRVEKSPMRARHWRWRRDWDWRWHRRGFFLLAAGGKRKRAGHRDDQGNLLLATWCLHRRTLRCFRYWNWHPPEV